MVKRSNGIKLFILGIILGLCISMVAHIVFSQADDFEKLHVDVWSKPILTEHKDLSLYNSIISPVNQIPPHLDASSAMAKALSAKRGKYGGADVDPKHLGGFFKNDSNSFERQMWEWAIDKFKIRSVLDVGCGMGYSTLFFVQHPLIERVLCIEGSTDAIEHSLVQNITIQHDYTLGPFWPKQSFDMVWCVEFLEHMDEKYQSFYMSTFKKAKLLFVTASVQGGWNHVNIQKQEYWIAIFESYGFIYLENITTQARVNCPGYSWQLKYSYHDLKTNGDRKMPYFYYTGSVFLNSLFLQSTNIPRNTTLFDELLLKRMHQIGV